MKYKMLPPSNILAEEIVIGQMLLDSKARAYIIDNTVSNFFMLQKHRRLYEDISSIESKSDASLIIKNLWDQKILKKIGGISNIVSIVTKSQVVSTYSNRYIYTKYCIKVLQHNYTKRLFEQYSYSILQLSHFYQVNIEQMQKKANSYLNRLEESSEAKEKIEFRKSISKLLHTIQASSKVRGKILSGFSELDKITNGFNEGDLIIIAGRPSMGKTSFAINIAGYTIFTLQLLTYIFSLEMSKDEILDKLVALKSHISIRKIQQRAINKYEWGEIQEACRLLLSSSLMINDQNSSSIEYIKTQYSNCAYKKKL